MRSDQGPAAGVDRSPSSPAPDGTAREDHATDGTPLEVVPTGGFEPSGGSPRRRETWRRLAAVAVVAGIVGAGVGAAGARREHREELRRVEEQLAEEQARHNEVLTALRARDAPAFVVIPDVVGLPLADAQGSLRASGLRPEVLGSDGVAPESVVVAQEPPGGIRVRSGAAVGLRTRSG